MEEEVWAVPVEALNIPKGEMQAFDAFSAFFTATFSTFLQGIGKQFPAFSNLKLQKNDGFEGFPVKSVDYKDDKPGEIWQVTRVDVKPVELSKFAPPDDYKKESLMPLQ